MGLPLPHPPAYPGWLDPQEAARSLTALGQRTSHPAPRLLATHLAPEDILLDTAFTTLAELFAQVGSHVAGQGWVIGSVMGSVMGSAMAPPPWRTTSLPTAPQIAAALTRRENLGTTRLHGGTHLPHARLPGLPAPRALYLRRAMNTDANPGANTSIHSADTPTQALVVLVPYPATPEHLLLLAAAHRQLASPGVTQRLARAGGWEEVWGVLMGGAGS